MPAPVSAPVSVVALLAGLLACTQHCSAATKGDFRQDAESPQRLRSADLAGATLRVLDMAVDVDAIGQPGGYREVARHKVRRGSGSIDREDALTRAEAEQAGHEAVEKLKARPVEPGKYDLVLHPTHLWLTIHESIGHPTELDRAMGYEANYAGTSFVAPPEKQINILKYGTPIMNIQGDRTQDGSLARC